MATNLQRLPGLSEADLHPSAGARTHHSVLHLVGAQTQNVNARPIGGAASIAVTEWTSVTVAGTLVPFGATLVALVAQASPTTGTIQLRVRGIDQFGEYIEELTPVVNLAAKTNNYIYLARVFVAVLEVAYKSTGLDIAGDTLSLGQRWDWTRTIDGTNEHIAGRNLGIPLPLRAGFRRAGSSRAANRMSQPVLRQEGVRASAVLTASAISNNDTVTIDGVVYTFKTTPSSTTAGEVLIGGSVAAALANLAAAIGASRGGGTQFGSLTSEHPTVRVAALTATTLTVEAKETGSLGNLIAVAETGASTAWGSAVLTLGVDDSVEVLGVAVQDITGGGSAGAIANLNPRHFAQGLNESGWLGSVEKIHILAQSSVAQWANTDNVLVHLVMRSSDSRLA